MRRSGKARKGETMVAAVPFKGWLNTRYADLLKADGDPDGETVRVDGMSALFKLADEVGFTKNANPDAAVRRLFRYRNGVTETARGKRTDGKKARCTLPVDEYPRSIVEDACDSARPGLFYELYPEFAHEMDVTLEPDAWCPFCEQDVTPIGGLCPWCVCEHGHLFREVGVSDDGFVCLGCAKKADQERRKREQARRYERERARKEAA